MAKEKYKFKLMPGGRTGEIICQSTEYKVVIGWEISGDKKYDILLAPLWLLEWAEPNGMKIKLEEQIEILHSLRNWLKRKKIKTDIDLPDPLEFDKEECKWIKCYAKRLKDSMFCLEHYNKLLLRK